jgi:hypothetical protein
MADANSDGAFPESKHPKQHPPLRTASPMDLIAWYPGFELYAFFMRGRKIPVTFTHAAIEDDEWGFIALYADIDEAFLPRSHTARGFPLHMSLGFAKSLCDNHNISWNTTRLMVDELNVRYAGKKFSILLDRIGCGGAACFHENEPLSMDPIIDFIYQHGGIDKGELHISL